MKTQLREGYFDTTHDSIHLPEISVDGFSLLNSSKIRLPNRGKNVTSQTTETIYRLFLSCLRNKCRFTKMGGIASKRVKAKLGNSPEFNSACDSAYNHCLSLTQYAFHGVFPYQLPTAATHLYNTVSTTEFPVIHKWVSAPPTRSQIDMALRVITRHQQPRDREDKLGLEKDPELLGQAQFKEWAVELFGEAVVGSAGKAILTRVPMGVAGIAGIGAATRSGRDVVGTAIGVYALGVAAWVYIGLSG